MMQMRQILKLSIYNLNMLCFSKRFWNKLHYASLSNIQKLKYFRNQVTKILKQTYGSLQCSTLQATCHHAFGR